MTKKIVSLNLAEELLERAVAEKGEDYVYPNWQYGCSYEGNGAPGCIVGHVLSYLGLTPEQLNQLDHPGLHFTDVNGDRMSDNSTVDDIATLLSEEFDIDLTRPAQLFLNHAQTEQDGGAPWSVALEEAKAEVAQYLSLIHI